MKRELAANPDQSVLLAHPNRLILESIASVIRGAGFRIAGQSQDEAGLLKMATELKPDIVVMDREISEQHIDVVRRLVAHLPNSIVVILVRAQTAGGFLQAIEAGAKGHLSVELTPDEFVQSLEMLAKGDVLISRDMAELVREELSSGAQMKPQDGLSDRERQILLFVGHGSTNREIAQELIISEHTVKAHLRTILNKLNLRNRQQAAAYAAKIGLVKEIGDEESAEPKS